MIIRKTTLLLAFLFAGIAECDAYPFSLIDGEAHARNHAHHAPATEAP